VAAPKLTLYPVSALADPVHTPLPHLPCGPVQPSLGQQASPPSEHVLFTSALRSLKVKSGLTMFEMGQKRLDLAASRLGFSLKAASEGTVCFPFITTENWLRRPHPGSQLKICSLLCNLSGSWSGSAHNAPSSVFPIWKVGTADRMLHFRHNSPCPAPRRLFSTLHQCDPIR